MMYPGRSLCPRFLPPEQEEDGDGTERVLNEVRKEPRSRTMAGSFAVVEGVEEADSGDGNICVGRRWAVTDRLSPCLPGVGLNGKRSSETTRSRVTLGVWMCCAGTL